MFYLDLIYIKLSSERIVWLPNQACYLLSTQIRAQTRIATDTRNFLGIAFSDEVPLKTREKLLRNAI